MWDHPYQPNTMETHHSLRPIPWVLGKRFPNITPCQFRQVLPFWIRPGELCCWKVVFVFKSGGILDLWWCFLVWWCLMIFDNVMMIWCGSVTDLERLEIHSCFRNLESTTVLQWKNDLKWLCLYEAIQMEMQSGQISGKTLVSGTFLCFFWLKQALPPSPETTLPQKNMKKNWQRWADKDSALRYISPKDNFVCATWLRSNQLLHLTPGLKVVLVKIIIEKSGNATRKHETEWSCKVALGGIAAEYVTYGQANGGMSDLIQLEVGEDLMKIRSWCKYWWWVFMPGMPAITFHFLLHHFFWWLSILRGLLDA